MVATKLCVVTGSRAEYGQLKSLLFRLYQEKEYDVQLLVTGMHLSAEHGSSFEEIEKDGFIINERVAILQNSDSADGIVQAMSVALVGFSEALMRLRPNLVILIGDRYEMLCAAIAAHVSHYPIAHIAGGETTQGAIDEAFRHSITKMSNVHFPASDEYRKRIIQLGEAPDTVFNVGGLAIDGLKSMPFLSREALENELKCKFNQRNLLITYHPATLEKMSSRDSLMNLLTALDSLQDTSLLFTKANVDAEGKEINQLIEDYVGKNVSKAWLFPNMGRLKYLSTMRFVDGVVGNSSSGLVEAPSFNIGTVNIGDRQKGRMRATSVIDTTPDRVSILAGIKTLYSDDFRNGLFSVVNPYGDGHASEKIIKILKSLDLFSLPRIKAFYDLEVEA